jgi:hypothetical protein
VPPGPPAPPQVTLMYFEGCRPITSTVLLKGAGLELLRKLKAVMGFAVLTAWNQRLESAFLADLLTAAVASAGEEGADGLCGGAVRYVRCNDRWCEHGCEMRVPSIREQGAAYRRNPAAQGAGPAAG